MADEAGVIHIPWYATLFRAEKFEAAVAELAPVALRYGAVDYEVYRSREDPYKFLQTATWERKIDFTAYWEGPECIEFRTRYSGWFQVPVLYQWNTRVISGALVREHSGPLAPG